MDYLDQTGNLVWAVYGFTFIAATIIAVWAEKKRSTVKFWPAFFISLFLTPFVGVLCVALSPMRPPEAEAAKL